MKTLIYAALVYVLASRPDAWSSDAGEDLLLHALIANAAGECPATLMAPSIKADCDRQLPAFRETLVKLGTPRATSFQGTRELKGGPAEVYKVTFEHGDMTWIIRTQEDGRLQLLWAPNGPEWNVGSFSRYHAPQQ